MHQVAMIGDDVGEAKARGSTQILNLRACARRSTANLQTVTVDQCERSVRRLEKIDSPLKIGGVGTPPQPPEKKKSGDQDCCKNHGAPRAAIASLIRRLAAFEVPFAHDGAHNENGADG